LSLEFTMAKKAREEKSPNHGANPFVFIVGCPRSGTTLLQRIVNAHPQIAVTPETQWLPRFFNQQVGCTPEGRVTPDLVPQLLEHPRFADLGISRPELERLLGNGEPATYAGFVSGLFDRYGQAQGKPLAGDKTPGYVRKIRILHALWPRAKFVHLIRDGRDVCLSTLDWKRKADRLADLYPTWAEEPVVTAALWWDEHVRRGRKQGRRLGGRLYYEIRYEALVARPEEECARLCAFLGVPYDPAMLCFHEGRTSTEPGLSRKDAWLPITPGLRDWRTQMAPENVDLFEAAAGPLLDELGYPRAVPQPRAEALDRASRVTALLAQNAAAEQPCSPSTHAREEKAPMSPLVFIVGCARSGTTLLHRIVDAHPQIAITPELHWVTHYFRDHKKWFGPHGRVTPDQVAAMIQNTKRFAQLGFSPEEFEGLLAGGRPVPYATFLNGLFGLYQKHSGKPLVGNKTPAYVRRIPVLHKHWPLAKFVHIVRDGRDVCLSVLNWYHADRTAGRYATWAEDPVVTTALWWERKVRLGRQGGQSLRPDLYYEISYDRLVHQPAEECGKLCAFLGVPYEEKMLRFHEGRTKNKPGLDAKTAWKPITPGLRDWRTQMPPADVERFEAAVGELLDELGYPRAFPRPSAEAAERVARIREALTDEMHTQEEALPESW
jgi:hypothetical protein